MRKGLGRRALTLNPVHVQEALWVKLAAVLEQLHVAAVAVWHLQRVLAKKRDPLTHTLFLDVIGGDDPDSPLPCERVWCAPRTLHARRSNAPSTKLSVIQLVG